MIYAMKVNGTAALSGSQTLTLNSGGLILNGGMVSGGALVFNATPLIFAGTTTAGTIASAVEEQRRAHEVWARHARAQRG